MDPIADAHSPARLRGGELDDASLADPTKVRRAQQARHVLAAAHLCDRTRAGGARLGRERFDKPRFATTRFTRHRAVAVCVSRLVAACACFAVLANCEGRKAVSIPAPGQVSRAQGGWGQTRRRRTYTFFAGNVERPRRRPLRTPEQPGRLGGQQTPTSVSRAPQRRRVVAMLGSADKVQQLAVRALTAPLENLRVVHPLRARDAPQIFGARVSGENFGGQPAREALQAVNEGVETSR